MKGPTLANGRYTGLTEQPTAFGYAALLGMTALPFIAAMLPKGRRWIVFRWASSSATASGSAAAARPCWC